MLLLRPLSLALLLPSFARAAAATAAEANLDLLGAREPSVSTPIALSARQLRRDASFPSFLLVRDGDSDGDDHHMAHGAPLLELNEHDAQIPPPSYYTIDVTDRDPSEKRYPGLIVAHILFMLSAFFFVLPAGTPPFCRGVWINHALYGGGER
jgi:hypothetical protein